jgi:hypothetical protein
VELGAARGTRGPAQEGGRGKGTKERERAVGTAAGDELVFIPGRGLGWQMRLGPTLALPSASKLHVPTFSIGILKKIPFPHPLPTKDCDHPANFLADHTTLVTCT